MPRISGKPSGTVNPCPPAWRDAIKTALARLPPSWSTAPILLAVSGGADSMALLHGCASYPGRQFAVAHIRHGIRSDDDVDRIFVERASGNLHWPFHCRRCDTVAEASRMKLSMEAGARILRYEALASIAQEAGAKIIFTAHTYDDQIETLLLRLLRGCSPAGLSGIHAIRPVMTNSTIQLVRPFLKLRRQALRDGLARCGIAWRDDRSNADTRYLRNGIRRHLVPELLETQNGRDLLSALEDLQGYTSAYHHASQAMVRRVLARHASHVAGCWFFPRDRLLRYRKAARMDILAAMIRRLLPPEEQGAFSMLATLCASSCLTQRYFSCTVTKDIQCTLDHGWMIVHASLRGGWQERTISLPFHKEIVHGVHVHCTIYPHGEFDFRDWVSHPHRWEAALDKDRFQGPLRLRTRSSGGSYQAIGHQGTRGVSACMQRAGYPRILRDLPVVLWDDCQPIWIPGHAPNEAFQIHKNTRHILKISCSGLERLCFSRKNGN